MIPFIDGDLCEAKLKGNEIFIKLKTLYCLYPNEVFLHGGTYKLEGVSVVFSLITIPMFDGGDIQTTNYKPSLYCDYVYKLAVLGHWDQAKELVNKINERIFTLKRLKVLKKIHGELIISPLLKKVFKRIQNFFKSKDVYKQYGIKHRRGVLLYGPPGTGKSSFIHYVVSQYPNANLFENFYDFQDSVEENSLIGENPNIIYIDEIESKTGGLRERKDLLENLENICDNTLVLATTNLPEKLGPEFYNRPGRFEEAIYIGYPTLQEIESFLKSRDCLDLLDFTNGLNFAHLNELIYRTKINHEDPERASQEIKKIGDKPLSGSNKDAKSGLGFGADNEYKKKFNELVDEDSDDDIDSGFDIYEFMRKHRS